MINTITSNIFDFCEDRIANINNGSSVLIPHVCNNLGLFGAGFANSVKNRYPIVSTNFEMLGNKLKLGYVQYVSAKKNNQSNHEIIFANMIAQNGIINKKNPRPLNYEALVKSMVNVKNYILDNSFKDQIEIHCPKFGSGLAGGNWIFIKELIYDIWRDIPVYVYSLKK